MMSAISFDEAFETGDNFILAPGKKTENVGIITEQRVDRSSVPEGWYVYEIRHSSNGSPISVENNVCCNFYGTFLTKKPIKFRKDKDYYSLKCGYTYWEET